MSAAITYAQTAAHNAVATGSSITGQLRRSWTRTFSGIVSYSLIRGASVYTSGNGAVYELDRRTGATVWGPVNIGGANEVRLTLDGTTLVALSNFGYVAAIDARTGAVLWDRHFVADYGFAGSPTVTDGLVFIEGDTAYGGIGVALRGRTGAIAYEDDVSPSEGDIAPTVGARGQLYYNGVCEQIFAIAPATGAINWHHGGCTGGGTSGAVFFGGLLYADGGSILRPSDGTEVGNLVRDGESCHRPGRLPFALRSRSGSHLTEDRPTPILVDYRW